MKVHCLGTTGYHPSPTRHTACYYLPDLSLLFDAGTGLFRLVPELLKDPKQSLTILLSHAHLDHIVGLTFLLDALAVTSLETIKLIGEQEKLDAVREHLYNELLFPVAPSMEFVPLSTTSGSMMLGSTAIDWFPVEHPGGCIGYRLTTDDNKKIAYVTDTVSRPDAEYHALIEDLDLLLHECYFADEHQELAVKTGHSWISSVTDIVRKTKPKRTALIHINPLAEILGSGFVLTEEQANDLNMCIAEDGMTLEF